MVDKMRRISETEKKIRLYSHIIYIQVHIYNIMCDDTLNKQNCCKNYKIALKGCRKASAVVKTCENNIDHLVISACAIRRKLFCITRGQSFPSQGFYINEHLSKVEDERQSAPPVSLCCSYRASLLILEALNITKQEQIMEEDMALSYQKQVLLLTCIELAIDSIFQQ